MVCNVSVKKMLNIKISSALVAIHLLLAVSNQGAQAYIVHLDPGELDICFHEIVEPGIKLIFSYEVAEGGHYDIDVRIKDPSGVNIYSEDASESGKFEHQTTTGGNFELCFANIRSSQKEKYVMFDVDRSDVFSNKTPPDESGSTETPDEEISKLGEMLRELVLVTVSARHDVRYLTARDKGHKKLILATNATVVYWSLIEFVLLLVVTAGQVWYLKRFFETRRKA